MTKARDLASSTPVPSTVSTTELGYVDGVTSAIQTQVDSKLATATASSTYQTKAAAGLIKIVPSSVVVGSGSGSADSSGYVTFSGVSSVSLNGVFSSTYKNYRINFDNITMPTSATDLILRLRAGGVNTTTNYTGAGFYMTHNSATVNGATVSSIFISNTSGTGGKAIGYIDLFAPYEAQETSASYAKPYRYGTTSANAYTHSYAFFQTDSTQFDGFSLIPGAGTISGAVSVYGYN
jgi:hypothetical protein